MYYRTYVRTYCSRYVVAAATVATVQKKTIRRRRTQRDGGQPEERWAGVRCACDSFSG
eukprot:COSAG01_NODE_73477_length_244_cov_13.503448_1_plen_57_part_01